jgi:hypothetical protein
LTGLADLLACLTFKRVDGLGDQDKERRHRKCARRLSTERRTHRCLTHLTHTQWPPTSTIDGTVAAHVSTVTHMKSIDRATLPADARQDGMDGELTDWHSVASRRVGLREWGNRGAGQNQTRYQLIGRQRVCALTRRASGTRSGHGEHAKGHGRMQGDQRNVLGIISLFVKVS